MNLPVHFFSISAVSNIELSRIFVDSSLLHEVANNMALKEREGALIIKAVAREGSPGSEEPPQTKKCPPKGPLEWTKRSTRCIKRFTITSTMLHNTDIDLIQHREVLLSNQLGHIHVLNYTKEGPIFVRKEPIPAATALIMVNLVE